MPLKERFLSYVELHRSANAAREVFGSAHPKTTEAYAQANAMKRRVIEEIEELEYRMASLEK